MQNNSSEFIMPPLVPTSNEKGENSSIHLGVYAPGGAFIACRHAPLLSLTSVPNQINEPTSGIVEFVRERENKFRLREREERSEERESPDRVSILSRRNMINVMAHRYHHQDRRVPIYNIPLPHRRPTSRSGQTRGLDSDLPFLVHEALRFVSQNSHYFWNQETLICCSPPIWQPNGVGSLFTRHMSRSRHREHILPGVPKTLRKKRQISVPS